ncbi:MAG: hypothetical protein ABW275_06865 [Hansschlegelia sp.]
MRQLTACLSAAVIALGASALAEPALAADDMGSNPITELFDSLGMSHKEKPDIDYQERAPLVPPTETSNLPPPQAPGAAASSSGQWPRDPDVQRRAERKALEDLPTTETTSYKMGDRESRIDPTELGRRRIRGASVPQTSSAATQGDNEVSRVTPGELRSQRINRQAMTPPVAEGSRGKLSDPPKDYLQGNGTTATVQPAEQKSFWQKITGK